MKISFHTKNFFFHEKVKASTNLKFSIINKGIAEGYGNSNLKLWKKATVIKKLRDPIILCKLNSG